MSVNETGEKMETKMKRDPMYFLKKELAKWVFIAVGRVALL